MLSRFATKLTSSGVQNAIIARLNSSTAVATMAVGSKTPRGETIVDWETFKMPGAPYDGMGPLPPKPMWDPKLVRHYVIPEYWFQFLYPRTGLSGLYTLGAGFSAFLLSKEYYVICPETFTVPLNLFIAIYLGMKWYGPMAREAYYKKLEGELDETFELKTSEIAKYNDMVENIKTDQWRAQIQDLFNDAKKINLDMMLETEFLQRQFAVASAVKNKLDYQVAVEKVDKELAQDHMVQWIEDKVMAKITPESQKLTLTACIKELNLISAK